MPRITTTQRRRRAGRRQHLAVAARADSVVDVAEDLVGIHASDPATVFLTPMARMREPSVEAVTEALYDERSIVKVLGMRRTMFAVPVDIAAELHASSAAPIADRERARLVQMLEEGGIAKNGSAWLADVERATLEALNARGEATASDLSADVPDLAEKIEFGEGKKWGGTVGVSTRVLFLLAGEGHIIRGEPTGSWISSRYQWVPMKRWLGSPLPDVSEADAQASLLRRWLATYGPGTLVDLKWWSGWTVAAVKRALAAVDHEEVELDEGTGYVLAGDHDTVAPGTPWAVLLPALDQAVMAYKERGWFIGDHAPALFDRNGNVGPTIWWDGRVVGGWAHRPDGEIAVRTLEDVGAEGTTAVYGAAHRLEGLLGDRRFTPRFRTPVEKELLG